MSSEASQLNQPVTKRTLRRWPDHRTIWRWHFYAGLFTMPVVIILAVTGTIYLFKPQIHAWQEQPFDNLAPDSVTAPVVDQVIAGVASVDGGVFHALAVPPPSHQLSSGTCRSANRVLVRQDGKTVRVFVDPATAVALGSMVDDDRLTKVAKRIHGELLLGKRGSYLVELAACWTLVMVLTGVMLWWPKNLKRMGGVIYPRLTGSGRMFWKDLHSVGGVWVSALVVILIVTGLPWATFWGDYFKSIRRATGTAVVKQHWSGGHENHDVQKRPKPKGNPFRRATVDPNTYQLAQLESIASAAAKLNLAPPVLIRPPDDGSSVWNVESVTGNRPLRRTVRIDAASRAIVGESGFADRHWIDQAVGQGIALHEGQRFGLANQLLALMATCGLVLLSLSGTVLWWRRRSAGTLGAPQRHPEPTSTTWQRRSLLVAAIVGLAIALPLFGLSLVIVLVIERGLMGRLPGLRLWLGMDVPANRSS